MLQRLLFVFGLLACLRVIVAILSLRLAFIEPFVSHLFCSFLLYLIHLVLQLLLQLLHNAVQFFYFAIFISQLTSKFFVFSVSDDALISSSANLVAGVLLSAIEVDLTLSLFDFHAVFFVLQFHALEFLLRLEIVAFFVSR